MLQGRNPIQRRPYQENSRNNGPGFIVLESRDARGNTMRQIVPAGGRGGSPFTNFFALLEQLAGRQGQR